MSISPVYGIFRSELSVVGAAELFERLGLDLPDPLPGNPEDLRDLIQGVLVASGSFAFSAFHWLAPFVDIVPYFNDNTM